MYGLGQMMMGGGGGSAADGAPQMPQGLSGMMGAGGQNAQMGGLLGQLLQGNKGGMQMPMFANGPLGQALGSQGVPMGLLALLGRQLGK